MAEYAGKNVVFFTEDDMNAAIQQYEEETLTHFVIASSSVSFSTAELYVNTIRWNLNSNGEGVDIPFDKVPFCWVGRKYLVCQFGKRKTGIKDKDSDSDVPKTRHRRYKTTKKINCPAKVTIKKIVKFPDYKIAGTGCLKLEKNKSKNRLMAALKIDSESVLKDVRYYVKFSAIEDHNGHDMGEEAAKKEPIDQRVITKLEELAQAGITSSVVLQSQVYKYVEMELFKNQRAPPRGRRRYYPNMKDILNFLARYRKKTDKQGTMSKWRQNDLEIEDDDDDDDEDEIMAMEEEEEDEVVGREEREKSADEEQGLKTEYISQNVPQHGQEVPEQYIPEHNSDIPEHSHELESSCDSEQDSHVQEQLSHVVEQHSSGQEQHCSGQEQPSHAPKLLSHVQEQLSHVTEQPFDVPIGQQRYVLEHVDNFMEEVSQGNVQEQIVSTDNVQVPCIQSQISATQTEEVHSFHHGVTATHTEQVICDQVENNDKRGEDSGGIGTNFAGHVDVDVSIIPATRTEQVSCGQIENNDKSGEDSGGIGTNFAGHVDVNVSIQGDTFSSDHVLSTVGTEQLQHGVLEQSNDNIPEQVSTEQDSVLEQESGVGQEQIYTSVQSEQVSVSKQGLVTVLEHASTSSLTEQESVSEQESTGVQRQTFTVVPSEHVTVSKEGLVTVLEQICTNDLTEQDGVTEQESTGVQQQIYTTVPSEQATISEHGFVAVSESEQVCAGGSAEHGYTIIQQEITDLQSGQMSVSECANLQEQVCSSVNDHLSSQSTEEQARLLSLMNTVLLNASAQDVTITTTSAPPGESTILFHSSGHAQPDVMTSNSLIVPKATIMPTGKRKVSRIGLVRKMKTVMHQILDYSVLVKDQRVLQKFLGDLEEMSSEASQNACLDPAVVQKELERGRGKRSGDLLNEDLVTAPKRKRTRAINLSDVL